MLESLASLQENDLSKKVLVPLFSQIYGCRVVFTGGGCEKGRDIIIYQKDPLGDNYFIGVQAKKIHATPNSSSKSFQQLLTQLDQMTHEPAICPDSGKEVMLSELIFVTPYEIPEKSFDTHSGAYKDVIAKGVKVIDGKKILSLIDQHKPELIREISGDGAYIGEKIKPALSNKALMDALHFNETKQLCDIYCETKLELGNTRDIDNDQLIRYEYTSTKIKISPDNIHETIFSNESFFSLTNVYLYQEDKLLEINASFHQKEILRRKISAESNKLVAINSKISSMIASSAFTKLYPSPFTEEFNEFLKSSYRRADLEDDDYEELSEEIRQIRSLMKDRVLTRDAGEALKVEESKIEINTTVKFDGNALCKVLNDSIDKLVSYENSTIKDVKGYLNTSQRIECCYQVIKSTGSVFKQARDTTPRASSKVSITDVFDSGLNVVVLGDAGSGKTTNLQVYTKTLLESSNENLVIYLTLNDLASYTSKSDDRCLVKGIWHYLAELRVNNFSFQSLKDHLKTQNVRLILDSIDEAIVQHDWIISALHEFSTIYNNCQVITSSRFTVSDLHSLGFVSISLLPFDREQKKEFFVKWFSEKPELVLDILRHLDDHPELDKVITNPLSATIMASLQDSSVPLPNTEASLYKKRFELLSGLFDKFKGVNRMVSSPDIILQSSRELAYYMHEQNCRELSQEAIVSFLTDSLHCEVQGNKVFLELISPCEILLINPNGKYGFGHLRFQEYLASEQLVNLRKVRWDKILVSPWWHDVFLLYSQHAYEIEWLVDYATNNEMAKKTHKLLRKMISYRSSEKVQNTLNHRLEIALKSEIEG
ncbi:NACHT domain-containing protein [Vibrio lentus]|uniref:NACHT domain-containing protein n=1 Tax=Vibrio lentus TaxID=136468 RepID=UPI001481F424|nr:NACHT domain-containing protein [Vibrio lentus]